MFLFKCTSNLLLPEISNYCASSASIKKKKLGKIVLLYWRSGGLCEDMISVLLNLVLFVALS